MADPERSILEFYQLPTPYPSEWPAEKDVNESSDEESTASKLKRRKSRYQALERAVGNRRSAVPGAEGGAGNLVQADEADPLGTTDSVVRALKQIGVPLKNDVRLKNRFLLSSTTFSPALFLSKVHLNADTHVLLNGLDYLGQSIDQKSASLKVLVESNFERFVRAKATIDNVYKEMKSRGSDSLQPRTHGSQHGRNSFRRSMAGSGSLGSQSNSPMPPDNRKKNALIKESEYGVMGIKTPLLDVSAKAEDVWGPALGGREKEEYLKVLSKHLTQFRECVELSTAIADSIKRKDYESLVEEYNKARRFTDDTRKMAQGLQGVDPDDGQLYQMLMAGRMWHDVDQQIQAFKRDMWKRLSTLHGASRTELPAGRAQDQHMEIIGLLLELGVDDNPIWVWLLSRYDHLKGKIQAVSDRSKVEIEVLRRRLANGEKPTPQTTAYHLRNLGRQPVEGKPLSNDSADVIELWEKTLAFMSNLLSSQGILGEMVDFWQTTQGFIEGTAQISLPVGYNGESRGHHQLSAKLVTDLEKGVVELVELMREHVYAFFAGPPPEDISLLFSPLPQTPGTPAAPSPMSAALSPAPFSPINMRDPRFNFDSSNAPAPTPKRGETWEKLAFWPPWANSLSGVHYLSKMLALVGSGASDMANIDPVASGDPAVVERLKMMVNASRERCVTAICAAWNRDAENIKYVEDWQRSTDMGDVTRMPTSFAAFEGTLLSGMQKILYVSDAGGDIVTPPPLKLLRMVQSQYVTTLYKALSGMVENAERSQKKAGNEWSTDEGAPAASMNSKSTLDAGDRNIRMLLTLSNLQTVRHTVVPNLNSQFENSFSVKLTDESKTIRDVLGQIDARLFQSCTKSSIEKLRNIITTGLNAPDWVPPPSTRPSAAKPYVYEALLTLVLVHSQVSTTAPSLTKQVLSFLLEQTSTLLLEAFRKRARYPLEALMQATLDVEFVAQTLSTYTTSKATELQSQIYQELDSRTDNDARARLQSELPEMRSVLKKLRDASKNEFACFKKVKRPGQSSRTTSNVSNS